MKKFYYTRGEAAALLGAPGQTIVSVAKRLRLKILKKPYYRFTESQLAKISQALPLYRKMHRRKNRSTAGLTPSRLKYLKDQAWTRIATRWDHAAGKFSSSGSFIFTATCAWCGLELMFDAKSGEIFGPGTKNKCSSKKKLDKPI